MRWILQRLVGMCGATEWPSLDDIDDDSVDNDDNPVIPDNFSAHKWGGGGHLDAWEPGWLEDFLDAWGLRTWLPLNKIQLEAARIIAGAYGTTSAVALNVELFTGDQWRSSSLSILGVSSELTASPTWAWCFPLTL